MQMEGNEAQEEMKEVEEELKGATKLETDETLEGGGQKPARHRSFLQAANNLAQFVFSPVFVQTFVMTFLAEWGDRSQVFHLCSSFHLRFLLLHWLLQKTFCM